MDRTIRPTRLPTKHMKKQHSGRPVSEDAKPFQTSPTAHNHRLTRWLLCLICFLSGASTLIIEIAGNRLLSPLFGNSIYTWTALIGVVLVAISVGDYLGGVLADRDPRLSLLGYLLLSASAWTLLVPWLQSWLPRGDASNGLMSGPLLASLFLFAVPACLLAAVGPFIVRHLSGTRGDHEIGLSAGLVGMLTTLGSFVGTVLTGFCLIPLLGVRMIFVLTGLATGVIGVVALAWRRTGRGVDVLVPIATLTALASAHLLHTPTLPAGVVHQEQTFYHDLRVEESITEHGESVRSLRLDTTLEGAQYIETGGISMTCNLYWRLAEVYCPRLESGLFLGGGGFAMPEDFSRRHPNARSDVCEIDPAVIDIGRRYFRLDEFPRVTPTARDARCFLAACRRRYDFIFGDAFHGLRNIPSHLISREFFALVKSRLSDDGIFLMNIISPIQGPQSTLLHSIRKTLRAEFAYTATYGVNATNPAEPQNVIVMASVGQPHNQDRPAATDDVARFLLSTRVSDDLDEPDGTTIFTDDYNPSERMIAKQLYAYPEAQP